MTNLHPTSTPFRLLQLSMAGIFALACAVMGANAEVVADRSIALKGPRDAAVAQGGNVDVDISVTRQGFTGPVHLEFRGLPKGVSVATTPLTIPAGQDSIRVNLRAAPDAPDVNEQFVRIAASPAEQKDITEAVVDFKLDVKRK